tara:strand:+ start:649 stop:849 length:201 start_codon:yes stop_codon:yes gene_type:complete
MYPFNLLYIITPKLTNISENMVEWVSVFLYRTTPRFKSPMGLSFVEILRLNKKKKPLGGGAFFTFK